MIWEPPWLSKNRRALQIIFDSIVKKFRQLFCILQAFPVTNDILNYSNIIFVFNFWYLRCKKSLKVFFCSGFGIIFSFRKLYLKINDYNLWKVQQKSFRENYLSRELFFYMWLIVIRHQMSLESPAKVA